MPFTLYGFINSQQKPLKSPPLEDMLSSWQFSLGKQEREYREKG